MSLYKIVMHFKKWSGFFGPPCTCIGSKCRVSLVEFKLALLIHKSLLGQLPPFLADDCQLIADSGQRTTHASIVGYCDVRRSTYQQYIRRSEFRCRWSYRIWNGLLSYLRSADLSTERFKRSLKTFFLFETAARLLLFA